MAEALESIGDQWAVYGFSSHYRDKVDFYVVHDFDERFGSAAKMRFETSGHGPDQARSCHPPCQQHPRETPFAHRLLILLSDGRPYDIDTVMPTMPSRIPGGPLEGRRKGVSSFCITVDKKSRDLFALVCTARRTIRSSTISIRFGTTAAIYKRLTT